VGTAHQIFFGGTGFQPVLEQLRGDNGNGLVLVGENQNQMRNNRGSSKPEAPKVPL
jgi:hypothetical protein